MKASTAAEKKRARQGSGSGSDREGTIKEGTIKESVGNVSKKTKTTKGQAGSRDSSRQVSRAASPIPQSTSATATASAPQRSVPEPRSRAGSPVAKSPSSTDGKLDPLNRQNPNADDGEVLQSITEAEIIASIPAGGTTINQLLSRFRQRVGGNRDPFIALIRRNSRWDADTKKLFPRLGGE